MKYSVKNKCLYTSIDNLKTDVCLWPKRFDLKTSTFSKQPQRDNKVKQTKIDRDNDGRKRKGKERKKRV